MLTGIFTFYEQSERIAMSENCTYVYIHISLHNGTKPNISGS